MSNLRAAIDIGSNTILLLILDKDDGEVVFESRVTSLGKNLDLKQRFEEDSMNASYEALDEYRQVCQEKKIAINEVRVTATEASRVAQNAPVFYEKVRNELGFTVNLISGTEEAFLAASGVILGEGLSEKSEERVLMDIGGGSTELVLVNTNPFEVVRSVSLPLGSVRVSDWIEKGLWEEKQRKLNVEYDINSYKNESVLGVAGTMTSLINMVKGCKEFTFIPFDDAVIENDELLELIDSVKNFTPEMLNEKFPFLGKRSKAILGGYEVCLYFARRLGVKSYQVSFKGLVHGSIFKQENES